MYNLNNSKPIQLSNVSIILSVWYMFTHTHTHRAQWNPLISSFVMSRKIKADEWIFYFYCYCFLLFISPEVSTSESVTIVGMRAFVTQHWHFWTLEWRKKITVKYSLPVVFVNHCVNDLSLVSFRLFWHV
jgi:hypothetical protein